MSDIDKRLITLEAGMRHLRVICAVQFVILCAFGISPVHSWRVWAADSPPILRARGLIIEDSLGHARILLGSPLPKAADRLRQDATTTSMVFLDEGGHDRLTLGEEPEPQIAGKVLPTVHRIAKGFGVIIHDGDGNERGTYGWLSNGRALITLDRPGLDAWAAIVDDKTGFAGMRVEYPPAVAPDSNAIEIGTRGKQAFFRLQDTKEKDRAVFALGVDGQAEFKALDGIGHVTRDLILSQPER